ncbi:MAG: site-specific integrase, partial [Oscillospiraceae bacterium]|nr:site-specific integrase [Oscillospiraceae bacterium]
QLSACFNYAVRFYGLAKNPVIQCGPFGKGKANEMQFRTREEFYQFIGAVDKSAARLAFEILFWFGIR